MDHKTTLKETINIREEITWELETDAVIFRNEFNYYLEKFKKDKSEHILIFVFIMLQIYVEYFLHQNMRRVIRFEFEHNNKSKYEEWIKNEFQYIPDKKIKGGIKKGKISIFIEYFLLNSNHEATMTKEQIESVFNEITKIRNLFVHGHKISLSGNADSSHVEISKAKGYLTENMLKLIIKNVNLLGKNWDRLLDLALSNCKSLNIKVIGDFKFDNLDYKK